MKILNKENERWNEYNRPTDHPTDDQRIRSKWKVTDFFLKIRTTTTDWLAGLDWLAANKQYLKRRSQLDAVVVIVACLE